MPPFAGGGKDGGPMNGTRVVFIGGLGRSGSTLLERLLGELPGACPVGESVHLWQRCLLDGERCGCGAAFDACAFWQKVGQAAFGGWDRVSARRALALQAAVDRTRTVPRLAGRTVPAGLRAALGEYGALYARLYAAVLEVGGADVVVDSSKHVSLAYCLRWCAGVDLRVVHVVRDARAVAHAWSKTVARPEAGAGSAEGGYMARFSPVKAAALWDAQNLGFDLLARRGVPTLRVRYEDFTREPGATLRRVAEFAGLPAPDAGMLTDDGAMLGVSHTASGNPMRFRTGRVRVRGDETWRAAMPVGRRRLVSALTLPVLARYGYPAVARSASD